MSDPIESRGILPGQASQAEKVTRQPSDEAKRLFTQAEKKGAVNALGTPRRCPVCGCKEIKDTETGKWKCKSEACRE